MQKKIQSASATPRLETAHIVQCAMCGLFTRRQADSSLAKKSR